MCPFWANLAIEVMYVFDQDQGSLHCCRREFPQNLSIVPIKVYQKVFTKPGVHAHQSKALHVSSCRSTLRASIEVAQNIMWRARLILS